MMDEETVRQIQNFIEDKFEHIKKVLLDFDGPPSRSNLELLVAACRGKPCKYDRKPLHGKVTAFFVALADCDLVRVCEDAEEPLEEMGYFHELSHPLLGHIPRISLPITYNEFLKLPEEVLVQLYHRYGAICRDGAFTKPEEFACELLATKIRAYMEEYKPKKIAKAARSLYRGSV